MNIKWLTFDKFYVKEKKKKILSTRYQYLQLTTKKIK